MAAENSPLHHMNKLHLKYIQIENSSFKQFYAPLVSISDFQKILLYIIQILSKLLIKSVVHDLHIIQLNLSEQRQENEKCISPEIISQLFQR